MHPPATAPRFEPALAPAAGRRQAQAGPEGRAGRARRERTGRLLSRAAAASRPGYQHGRYGGGAATEVGLMDGDADARPCSDRAMPSHGRNGHGKAGRAEARHVSPTWRRRHAQSMLQLVHRHDCCPYSAGLHCYRSVGMTYSGFCAGCSAVASISVYKLDNWYTDVLHYFVYC